MRLHVLNRTLKRAREIGVRNILALRGDEPRDAEYDGMDASIGQAGFEQDAGEDDDVEPEDIHFVYAVDLVRHIRRKYGDWFCIGVAAYPEGHTTSPYGPVQSTEKDIPYLIQKTEAGADFIMTQLFYDVDAFLEFEKSLRSHPSGVFRDIPIIPGLMPVQSWGTLMRTTKLTCAQIPRNILDLLEPVKGDDESVKEVGLDALKSIVDRIKEGRHGHPSVLPKREANLSGAAGQRGPQGFHFYTLNLEKVVARLLEDCGLIPATRSTNVLTNRSYPVENGDKGAGHNDSSSRPRRRLSSFSSDPQNRIIVSKPHRPEYEATSDEASSNVNDARSATWDDFPNGRFGDARSPAFGNIDGYGPTIHFPPSHARLLWGHPTKSTDITSIFRRYLMSDLQAIPWSEESLSSETALIRPQLLKMNELGWWTVASQPAVDCAKSDDAIVGWGPKVGGWVWQRPFVEFFIPTTTFHAHLKPRLDAAQSAQSLSYLAGDASGNFTTPDHAAVHPVTWGAFRGKEIQTPTMIEGLSFRAWQGEAFDIWSEWRRAYPVGSESEGFLKETRAEVSLVCAIGMGWWDGGREFWDVLLGGNELDHG